MGILAWNSVMYAEYFKQEEVDEINRIINNLDEKSKRYIQDLMVRKEEKYSEYKVIYSSFEMVEKFGNIAISTAVIHAIEL